MDQNNTPQQPATSLGDKIKTLGGKLKVFWNTPPKNRYLNLKEILCFAGSAFGVSTLVTVVSGLITATQISETFEISVLHGPYICLAASLLGLIIQPFFGKLLQNTNTKWGKYKPFIILMAPIFAACAIAATWHPENLDESARTIYAYCTCIPTLVIWNLFNNTFYMMPAVVTPNQQERTDIWAPIGLVIGFSPTVMNFLVGFIRSAFLEQGNEAMAYRVIGFVYAAVGLALVMLLFKVRERIIVTQENKEKVGLFQGMRLILKNTPLLILSLALIVGCVRTAIELDAQIMGKLRYASNISDGLKVFSSLTLITGFAVTPNMILLPFMTRKFNNKTILIFWSALNMIGYLILGLIGVENIPQGTVSAVVLTALRFVSLFNALASLQPLMLSEIYDYQQYKTGQRLEGFIQMFAYALVLVFTNLGYVVLAYVKQGLGYEPANYFNEAVQVSDELMAIATNYFDIAFIVSAVSAGLMMLVMFFYPLTKKQHKEIVAELERRSKSEGLYDLDKTVVAAVGENATAEIAESEISGSEQDDQNADKA